MPGSDLSFGRSRQPQPQAWFNFRRELIWDIWNQCALLSSATVVALLRWIRIMGLGEFYLELSPQGKRGLFQKLERHGRIVVCKKPIESSAVGVHSTSQNNPVRRFCAAPENQIRRN